MAGGQPFELRRPARPYVRHRWVFLQWKREGRASEQHRSRAPGRSMSRVRGHPGGDGREQPADPTGLHEAASLGCGPGPAVVGAVSGVQLAGRPSEEEDCSTGKCCFQTVDKESWIVPGYLEVIRTQYNRVARVADHTAKAPVAAVESDHVQRVIDGRSEEH